MKNLPNITSTIEDRDGLAVKFLAMVSPQIGQIYEVASDGMPYYFEVIEILNGTKVTALETGTRGYGRSDKPRQNLVGLPLKLVRAKSRISDIRKWARRI